MIAEKILPLLDGVKQTGDGTWIAKCCVHDDNNPSMGIKEVLSREGEPTLLIRCFSCQASIDEICSSLGIQISDLYPEKIIQETESSYKNTRAYFPAKDVLSCLHRDALTIEIIGRQMQTGALLSPTAIEVLSDARQRVETAIEYCK